jgi:hypothetical protein
VENDQLVNVLFGKVARGSRIGISYNGVGTHSRSG